MASSPIGQRQRQILRTVHTALQPLAQALQAHRCRSADMVARQKNPAFFACMTALLRWPDTLQPLHLLKGYPIVGHVQPCGVFRPIHQDDKLDPDEWLVPGFATAPHIQAPPLCQGHLGCYP